MIKIRGKWTAVLQTFFEATARWRWSGGMSALKFFEVLRSLSVQVWRLSGRQMLCRPRGRTSAGMISTAMTRDTFHLHLEFLKATAHLTVCVNDMRCAKVSVLWWFCASLNHNLAYILKVRCELKRVWKKYEDCPSETERCDFKRENMNNKKRTTRWQHSTGFGVLQKGHGAASLHRVQMQRLQCLPVKRGRSHSYCARLLSLQRRADIWHI